MSATKNIMRPRGSFEKREPKEYEERVIEIARVSRVAKGGRRIRFRALLVIGNRNGKIGMGIAKANEVAEAVKKAVAQAKKHIVEVPIINGTIPHEVFMKHGGAYIMIKPATSGTSIVAGGSIRSVAELAGITDLLAKSLGSANKINNVTATIKALSSFNPDVVARIQKYSVKTIPAAKVEVADTANQADAVKKAAKPAEIKKDAAPKKVSPSKADIKSDENSKKIKAKK